MNPMDLLSVFDCELLMASKKVKPMEQQSVPHIQQEHYRKEFQLGRRRTHNHLPCRQYHRHCMLRIHLDQNNHQDKRRWLHL